MTDKAKSPKAAPMAANSTGLYLRRQGLLGQRERVDEGLHQAGSGQARAVDEVAAPALLPRFVPNRRSISGNVTLKFTAAIRPRM